MLLKSYSLFFAFCLCLDISAISIDLKNAIEWDTALGHAYQLESTVNGLDWTSVGSEQSGNNNKQSYILSSVSHETQYRVRETIPGNAVPNTTVPNSGFELENLSSWSKYGRPQPSHSIISKNGSYSARLYVNKDENTGLESKIVSNRIGGISEGDSYALDFWANKAQSGVSLVIQYEIEWHGNSNQSTGLINFDLGDAEWQNVIIPNLIAPTGANEATVTFRIAIGAISGAKGEIFIDDVVFSNGSTSTPDQTVFHENISPQRIAEISIPTDDNIEYLVYESQI